MHTFTFLVTLVVTCEPNMHLFIWDQASWHLPAFTSICGAIVMVFCVISFFQRFAQILVYTILMSVLGSFIMYLSLTETMEPSQPTYLVDRMLVACCNWLATMAGTSKNAKKEQPDNNSHHDYTYKAGEPAMESDTDDINRSDDPEYDC